MQEKIERLVKEYVRLFPDEYQAARVQVAANRKKQKNEMASGKGDIVERALIEYPETLFTIFLQKLSEEELTYLGSKTGVRWFAKQFPEFRVAERV